jgi:hypothetical protein
MPGNAATHSYTAGLSEASRTALFLVDASYLHSAMTAMRDAHGTVDAYLANVLDIDASAQERLRAALLD